MKFKNTEQLKKYLMSHMKNAIQKSQQQVYQILDRFMKEYYAEYDPIIYERTYQLYKSLVKTDVVQTGNGYKAYVYFDATNLDYQIKHFTQIQDVNGYMNPFTHRFSESGTFANPSGDAEKTLESAMHGLHGGKIPGTNIWGESTVILHREMFNILKRMLISEGIPVK